jgi:hypothetical protein
MYPVILALLLGATDLALFDLMCISINRNEILGLSMLALITMAVFCHALLFRS